MLEIHNSVVVQWLISALLPPPLVLPFGEPSERCLLGSDAQWCSTTSRSRSSSWRRSLSLRRRCFVQVAYRCWRRSLAGLPVVQLLLEVVAVYQVVEVFFQVLQLLVGCRVGVAVRASPLQ